MEGKGRNKLKITMKQQDYQRIVEHARKNLPNEACGLLGGKITDQEAQIEAAYLLHNPDQSPVHFSIDPQEQLQAIVDMRKKGMVPLGNFHSHPESPARPSQEDIRMAYDPRAIYMILSLAGETPQLRAFHIEQEAATILELCIL